MFNDDQKLQLLLSIFGDRSATSPSTQSKEPEKNTSLGQSLLGQGVIVRCRDAGVHYGELIGFNGRTVELKNSRRMWRWFSANENTLSGVCRHGINQEKSKISGVITKPMILSDACEILPFESNSAELSVKEAAVYNEQ